MSADASPGRASIHDQAQAWTAARGRRWPTEPSLWAPLLAALVLVALPLLGLHAAFEAEGFVARVTWGNPICIGILWAFAGTILYLLVKRWRLGREVDTTDLLARQVLPVALERQDADGTPAETYGALEQELQRARRGAERNLLLARCRFLAHFARSSRNAASDGTTVEQVAGPLDRDRMHASFAFVRFMVWAIPIVGFIGTVWGISSAISHFSGAMANVQNAAALTEELQKNLPGVTGGLAVAFDTTFLALAVSLPLVLAMTWLEKREDNYLSELDELWLGTVAPRLSKRTRAPEGGEAATGAAPQGDGSVNDELRLLSEQVRALQDVMRDLHQDVVVSGLRKAQ